MLPYGQILLPSSPFSSINSSWDEALANYFVVDRGLICPGSILKEYTSRTEEVLPMPISMARQVPDSPLIKQDSDCGYSSPDYTYTSSNENYFVTQADRQVLATPKLFSWDLFIDEISDPNSVKSELQLPVELEELYRPIPQSLFPQINSTENGFVSILKPIPQRHFDSMTNAPHVTQKLSISEDTNRPQIPQKKQLFVSLRFMAYKPFLAVVQMSGPEKEYKLPIFKQLKSFEFMLASGKYTIKASSKSGTNANLLSSGSRKRYASRLTLSQLAYVLGVQYFDMSLVKDIESIILEMCDQLCGLKIGESSWSRSIPRTLRKASVTKVHSFAKLFFPSFTMETIQTIIKRGAYSRTQDFLRRKRRRARKFSADKKVSSEPKTKK
ncbi:hypothetical protein JCM33374_g3753 [Metschnikowia sp. JCM 33374]|nr:hypothetical protein JCM33374_g3753 [Metschnikowia sp. JCM 33374]